MPERSRLQAQFETGLQGLGLPASVAPDATQRDSMLDYAELLLHWNKTYNLIGRSTEADIVSRHLLDSLSAAPYIRGERWLDVGSGAGLPGIPLAIVLPDTHFTLLDSNGKKQRFLLQAISRLALENVRILQQRVEQHHPAHLYNGIISRAFASIGKGLAAAGHLCVAGGAICFMKGRISTEELREIGKPFNLHRNERLQVPGCAAERHLIELRKSA